MSQQGEAAEQIVNMATNVTVKGVEVATNLAGKGALSLATFLIAALNDQKRTKGKARMRAFHGKPTKVFVIRSEDMKQFAEEAKKYGVLYAAVFNKKQPDGIVDVVVNANDAAKVNRIAERFAMPAEEVEQLRASILKAREEKEKAAAEKERITPPAEKEARTADEQTLDEMMGAPAPQKTEHKQPIDLAEKAENPTKARMEKPNPSGPSSKSSNDTAAENSSERPSVKQQLRKSGRSVRRIRRCSSPQKKEPADHAQAAAEKEIS